MSARRILINNALATLDPDALQPRFKNDESRLSSLYFSGLRELLEQPRDVVRVFNTVRLIEPSLRGEVVFADIVGLASLMVKATPVFDLLRKNPNYFVGKLPNDNYLLEKDEKLVSLGSDERKAANAHRHLSLFVRSFIFSSQRLLRMKEFLPWGAYLMSMDTLPIPPAYWLRCN